jgi:hypothetical protein
MSSPSLNFQKMNQKLVLYTERGSKHRREIARRESQSVVCLKKVQIHKTTLRKNVYQETSIRKCARMRYTHTLFFTVVVGGLFKSNIPKSFVESK